MKGLPEERARELGRYIVKNKSTVRETASRFRISKSTVHKDVTERLAKTDAILWGEVKKVLEINKEERHIRGGLATKKKYEKERCSRFESKAK